MRTGSGVRVGPAWGIGLVFVLALSGCGSPEPQSADPAAIKAQLQQVISLQYPPHSGAPSVEVGRGKIVYVKVASQEPGEVSIPDYQLTQKVEPGKESVLVVSADKQAVSDVVMRGAGKDDLIGRLDVRQTGK